MKKILIFLCCVLLIVPCLCLCSFADTADALAENWNYQYGIVRGVFYRDGYGGTDTGSSTPIRIGGGIGNARVYIHLTSGARSYEFDTIHYPYDYLDFSVGSNDVDRVEVSLTTNSGVSSYSYQIGGDTLYIMENNVTVMTWDVSTDPVYYTIVILYNDSAIMSGSIISYLDTDFEDTYFNNITDLDYPRSMFIGSNYVVNEPKNLISLMMGSIGITGIGLATGVKSAVSNLIYVDPLAETKTFSAFAIFVFVIAGLSIAMTVFWLVFRLIRFGRQR